MATDKIRVKVAGSSEIKVSEGQTIVKKIVVGTPIRNVVQTGNILDSASGIVINGPLKPTDHIIPSNNELIDLGSFNNRFRSLYLAGATLFVGDLALSDSGGNLLISNIDASGNIVSGTQRSLATVDSDQIISTVTPKIDSAVNALIDAAPEQLNTLNELAAALNDDSDAFNSLLTKINAGVRAAAAELDSIGTDQIIDTFSSAEFRTVKYLVQLEHDSDNKYHSSEIILTHNGTDVFLTEYAEVKTDSSLGIFNANIVNNNITITLSPSYTNTDFKAKRISVDA
jgi:hypothetical protein